MEREERLRLEEEARLRLLADLLKVPKRARHRVWCTAVKRSGHALTVSVYHYPSQVRNFSVVAYHAPTGRSYVFVPLITNAALVLVLTECLYVC